MKNDKHDPNRPNPKKDKVYDPEKDSTDRSSVGVIGELKKKRSINQEDNNTQANLPIANPSTLPPIDPHSDLQRYRKQAKRENSSDAPSLSRQSSINEYHDAQTSPVTPGPEGYGTPRDPDQEYKNSRKQIKKGNTAKEIIDAKESAEKALIEVSPRFRANKAKNDGKNGKDGYSR